MQELAASRQHVSGIESGGSRLEGDQMEAGAAISWSRDPG
jgi:hypothetical protein